MIEPLLLSDVADVNMLRSSRRDKYPSVPMVLLREMIDRPDHRTEKYQKGKEITRVMRVHIHFVRQALKPGWQIKTFLHVSGRGYNAQLDFFQKPTHPCYMLVECN